MTEQLNLSFLRQPLWVLITFALIILPGFLAVCQLDLIAPFGSTVSEYQSCPNVLLSEIFIGRSVLSFFGVIIIFEALNFLQKPLRLTTIRSGWHGVLQFEVKTLLSVVSGLVIYGLLTVLLQLVIPADAGGVTTDLSLSVQELSWTMLVVLGLVNGWMLYNKRMNKINSINTHVECEGPFGKIQRGIDEIDWFEKQGRSYYLKTSEGQFKISLTLKELEEKLDPTTFVRINRSVILNIRMITGYSHWENEKYILRTENEKEFVVSRQRIKQIKRLMKPE